MVLECGSRSCTYLFEVLAEYLTLAFEDYAPGRRRERPPCLTFHPFAIGKSIRLAEPESNFRRTVSP